jgi:hypothetical protein
MNIEDVKYSVQLPPDGIWSEWRSINEPIKEELILSFKYNKVVTWPESNEICKRIFK